VACIQCDSSKDHSGWQCQHNSTTQQNTPPPNNKVHGSRMKYFEIQWSMMISHSKNNLVSSINSTMWKHWCSKENSHSHLTFSNVPKFPILTPPPKIKPIPPHILCHNKTYTSNYITSIIHPSPGSPGWVKQTRKQETELCEMLPVIYYYSSCADDNY
jgi:hypothetical protein